MIEWTNVHSRAIRRIGKELVAAGSGGFAADTWVAHVQFRRGRTYVYKLPNEAYFTQWVNAPSKGRYYVFIIKARFDFISRY